MGREIELKIPLSDQKYDFFYENLYVNKKVDGIIVIDSQKDSIFKQDEYYSKYKTMEERKQSSEAQVIRIRTEKCANETKSFFTIKRKSLVDGVEVNKEDETFVENADVLRELFEEAQYYRWFNKEKKSYSAYCKYPENPEIEFHVELVTVNGLKYIEIEVTLEELNEDDILNYLEDFVCLLGLNPKDKDERSWYTIISEMNKE